MNVDSPDSVLEDLVSGEGRLNILTSIKTKCLQWGLLGKRKMTCKDSEIARYHSSSIKVLCHDQSYGSLLFTRVFINILRWSLSDSDLISLFFSTSPSYEISLNVR
jgi:hypothetical protein